MESARFTPAQLARRIELILILIQTNDLPYEGGRNERLYEARPLEKSDPYDTGRESGFDPEARTKQQRAAARDAEIQRLEGQALVREGVYAEHVDHEKILEQAEQRDSRGSYRELRETLERMPATLRGEAKLRWLAENMPSRRIRVPYEHKRRLLEALKPDVAALRDAGPTPRQIAAKLGLERGEVREILAMLRADENPAKRPLPLSGRSPTSMVT